MAGNGKSLVERAEALTDRLQGALSGGVGVMLGSPGRQALQEVAALVEDLAREVENMKGGVNG